MTVPTHRQRSIPTPLAVAIAACVLVGIPALFIPMPGCACGSPKDRGRWGIQQIQQAQAMYFQRYGRFAPSLAPLEQQGFLSLPPRYQQSFQFSVQGNREMAVAYATPLQTELPVDLLRLGLHKLQFTSVVGAVSNRQGTVAKILCESKTPTPTQPAPPVWSKDQWTCPANFKEL
jgi:hypothetical protein